MSSKLPPVPHRVPVIDYNGFLSPVWSDWLQKVFIRVGGNIAETNDELYNVTTDRIANGAVTAAKIAAAVAGNGLTGGGGSALAVNPDGSTLEVSSDQIRIKDLGVSAAKIAAEAVNFAKLLSTDWSNNKAASGYQKLPSGLYVQWGVTGSLTSASSNTINFPLAFPNACLQVVAGVRDNSGTATTTTGQWGTGGYGVSSFSLYNRTSAAQTFNWIAIGH